MHKPAAILFDLDGTLLDTARDLGNALNHVLELNELPTCNYDTYRNTASHGVKGLLELGFGDRLKDFNLDVLRQQFLDYYHANICVDTNLFDGVEKLLTELNTRNVPWGIVTNKPGNLTDILLPNFSAFDQCKVVVSGDTLPLRKPDPAPLLHAAKAINIEVNKIWYIGDAQRDIEAANAANMISVIAEYGYISEIDKTEEWQGDICIDKACELIALL